MRTQKPIKKILVVCRSWPTFEHSGLAFCAGEHCTFLHEFGYELFIASSNPEVLGVIGQLPVKDVLYIPLEGFNFLTFRKGINQKKAQEAIAAIGPDLIVIEAWQTAIGDAFIKVASQLKIKVIMISHGVSFHSFSWRPRDLVRSLSWLPYRWLVFPRLMKQLTALSVLDLNSTSKRFFDRDLAKKLGIPVALLANAPIHYSNNVLPLIERKRQVLIIGYFSDIKNQLAALQVTKVLKKQEIIFKFIGNKTGTYFQKCSDFVAKHGLQEIVDFKQDTECDLALEISRSLIVFSPSNSEVLSLALLEAMASGTPVVATRVGANESLSGVILADTMFEQCKAILDLIINEDLWERQSREGNSCFKENFTALNVKDQLQKLLLIIN